MYFYVFYKLSAVAYPGLKVINQLNKCHMKYVIFFTKRNLIMSE